MSRTMKKIRVIEEDEESISFKYKDSELSGEYRLCKRWPGDYIHNMSDKNGTLIDTSRAQRIVDVMKAEDVI